jgi:hypothetical protein
MKIRFCFFSLILAFGTYIVAAPKESRKPAQSSPKPERPKALDTNEFPTPENLAGLKARGKSYCETFQKFFTKDDQSEACKKRLEIELPANKIICSDAEFKGLEDFSGLEYPLASYAYLEIASKVLYSDLRACGSSIAANYTKTINENINTSAQMYTNHYKLTPAYAAWIKYSKNLFSWYSNGN